jgi:DNA-binding winged helix-turn-helix (wHTH) protein/Tol biopolymer transport system component
MPDVYQFGPFALNVDAKKLTRGEERVPISPQQLNLLAALIESRGAVVEPNALIKRAWPDVKVGPGSLPQAIHRLRETLGDRASAPEYIYTSTNKGYEFIAPVRLASEPLEPNPVSAVPADAPLTVEISHLDAAEAIGPAADVPGEEIRPIPLPAGPKPVPAPEGPGDAPPRKSNPAPPRIDRFRLLLDWRVLIVGTAASAAVLFYWIHLPSHTPPRPAPPVADVIQLTDDGHEKCLHLILPGDTVYFNESLARGERAFSVPVGGGPVTKISPPGLDDPAILDARLPGPEMLLGARDSRQVYHLWDWAPGRTPRSVIETPNVLDAAWTWPRQDSIAVSDAGSVLLFQNARRVRSVPISLEVEGIRWSSPRNALRVSATDAGNHRTIWEVKGANGIPAPVDGLPPDSCCGSWNADGSVFTFVAPGKSGKDIWVEYHRPNEPAQVNRVTAGPVDYASPVPTPDGRRVIAVGTKERSELVSYHADSNRFVPFLNGIDAIDLEYSRDGRSIAYIRPTDSTLWKARANGSEAIQLTFPPMTARQPHWSPDGARIAFMGEHPKTLLRIYAVPSKGGRPQELSNDGAEQGVPSWSPTGSRIVYGDQNRHKPDQMRIHFLDVRSQSIQDMPGSTGLWTPRWSPNGVWISAISAYPGPERLALYDCRTGDWRDLAQFQVIEHPSWSADSRFLYFTGEDHPSTVNTRGPRKLYRVSMETWTLEPLVDVTGMTLASQEWFGVARDGTPLVAGAVRIQEIYSLGLPAK